MNIIYTKPNCSYCLLAKDLMNERNIFYNEIKIGENISRDEIISLFPTMKTVPIILFDNKLIGGYTDLVVYLGDIGDEKRLS